MGEGASGYKAGWRGGLVEGGGGRGLLNGLGASWGLVVRMTVREGGKQRGRGRGVSRALDFKKKSPPPHWGG